VGANNFAVLHCGTVTHFFGKGMTALEERLDPDKFLRIRRSSIVNRTCVVACHSMPGGVYEPELRSCARLKTDGQYRDRIHKLLSG
jgi:two-component system, LytTR family, response regulator